MMAAGPSGPASRHPGAPAQSSPETAAADTSAAVSRFGPGPVWRVGGPQGRALAPDPFLVAGIVNVTPDSFFDGGAHDTGEAALAHGVQLARDGADMVDVGGESTRPGSDPVPEAVELARVVPVVRELVRAVADPSFAVSPAWNAAILPPPAARPLVSVDTTRAACAAACLDAGAAIINDVSACSADPGLMDVLVQYRPGYVLMHSQGSPKTMQAAPAYDDVVDEVLAFFERGLTRLVAAGLPEEHVALDPGIGFGKLATHNLELLRGLPRMAALGRPVYLGLSNKSLFQGLFGLDVAARGPATMTATALCGVRGAHVHRVHDVTAARQGLALARELFFHRACADGAGRGAP
ncbi:dihydropteroate synthase [Desulfolutivibrio sp.]|uniref:dihydropteroate synthase n=1 Tax=Desulfolutivibrio sp. TaxID=2773296 RepID=UPI002F96C83A